MTSHTVTPHGYVSGAAQSQQNAVHDPTGQTCPPGAKPRVTATLWEDEGSLCYQVEAKGVCVARREDNHMINGTKLLNVAGMTRGRRDGILKSEKVRHVVKIGPMHLKGVWIPYERALDFANKEKITDLLYPLFVHNIGGLLYHPQNSNRTNMVVHDSQQRRLEGSQSARTSQGPQAPALHHHHSMNGSVPHMPPASASSVTPQANGRPEMNRAHTFPTPPASASSLIGIPNQGSTYDWNNQNMNSTVQTSQNVPIDNGMNNTRSMPTTPATTPPGNNLQGMPPYQNQPAYDSSKSYYSAAPSTQGQYASQPLPAHSLTYGQPIMKDLGSSGRPPLGPGEQEHDEVKVDRYNQPNGQVTNGTEEENGQQQEPEYVQDNVAGSYANRNSYTYTTNPSVSSLSGDHQLGGSPSHQNGSDRMTPRTAGANPPPQWSQGYNTPPRAVPAGSISNIVSDTRGAPNGESYAPSTAYTSNYSGYSSVNGSSMGSSKRMRDDDDDHLSRSDGRENEYETKRRKTLTEPPVGGAFMQMQQQPVPAGGVMRRR